MPEKSLALIESSGADLVLIVDAADMGVTADEFSLLELDDLKNMHFHSCSLPVFAVQYYSQAKTSALIADRGATRFY
jgi:Ni,Fe-hydrogenase maturation factor